MTALPAYRHVQPYTLLWLVLLPTAAVTGLVCAVTPGVPVALAAAVAGLPLVILLALGRLVIELDATELRWHFGWLGRPAWRVALTDVATVEKTRAPSAAGSGIRATRGQQLFNVTMGGPAVALTLRNGRRILLGTPEPDRLAAYIEARRGGAA